MGPLVLSGEVPLWQVLISCKFKDMAVLVAMRKFFLEKSIPEISPDPRRAKRCTARTMASHQEPDLCINNIKPSTKNLQSSA